MLNCILQTTTCVYDFRSFSLVCVAVTSYVIRYDSVQPNISVINVILVKVIGAPKYNWIWIRMCFWKMAARKFRYGMPQNRKMPTIWLYVEHELCNSNSKRNVNDVIKQINGFSMLWLTMYQIVFNLPLSNRNDDENARMVYNHSCDGKISHIFAEIITMFTNSCVILARAFAFEYDSWNCECNVSWHEKEKKK